MARCSALARSVSSAGAVVVWETQSCVPGAHMDHCEEATHIQPSSATAVRGSKQTCSVANNRLSIVSPPGAVLRMRPLASTMKRKAIACRRMVT